MLVSFVFVCLVVESGVALISEPTPKNVSLTESHFFGTVISEVETSSA